MGTTLTKDLLEKYGTDYFVETGTFHGAGVDVAIAAGMSDIRSVETHYDFFAECKDRFCDDTRVQLWHGDSLDLLPMIIENISDRITFWLDAHDGNSPTSGKKRAPLLEEIEIIGQHPIKDHVILIDDVRLFGVGFWEGVTQIGVINALLKINPNYVVIYENSSAYPEDILVAYVDDRNTDNEESS
jgi:hypothetical protein